MEIYWLLLAFVLVVGAVAAVWVRHPRLTFKDQKSLLKALERIAAIRNTARRRMFLDQLWPIIHEKGAIPYCQNDKALLIYRAPEDVSSVEIMGDHNRWQPQADDQFRRLGHSRVWILELELPPAARIDYKLRINERHITIDPNNQFQQWSGFGPNSEIRMPQFEANHATVPRDDTQKGYLEKDRRIESKQLGYRINYSIYHPMKERGSHLPVLYVTDGHEFLNVKLGSFTTVMDNLISQGAIPPCYVVFIDPRNTDRNINRRMDEYGHQYAKFGKVLVEELIPEIEQRQPDRTAARRGIVGTSLGGQFAAWVCARHGDAFGLGGILSPAFWFNERNHEGEILKAYAEKPEHELRLFLGIGTLEGLLRDAQQFHKTLTKHGIPHDYFETPQGHSWGSWRSMIDRMLIYLLQDH